MKPKSHLVVCIHVFIGSISLFSNGFGILHFLAACLGRISKQETEQKCTQVITSGEMWKASNATIHCKVTRPTACLRTSTGFGSHRKDKLHLTRRKREKGKFSP